MHRAPDEQTLSGTVSAGELSTMSVITDKQAVMDKQLQEHYHCPAERSAAAISVPPSHTFTHYPSVTHTHTHTRLGRLLSKRNCLQITECFLITVVIPTQCWVSLWLLYRCIWMTLEYRRLNGVSFHFNSTIIVILQERSSIFHLLKMALLIFFPHH